METRFCNALEIQLDHDANTGEFFGKILVSVQGEVLSYAWRFVVEDADPTPEGFDQAAAYAVCEVSRCTRLSTEPRPDWAADLDPELASYIGDNADWVPEGVCICREYGGKGVYLGEGERYD